MRSVKLTLTALWVLISATPGCTTPGTATGTAAATSNAYVTDRGAGKDNWRDSLPRAEWRQFRRIAQPQDWFEVYEVADGVLAIYEPGQFEEVISFLILGDDRALLLDTGLGIGDLRAVVSELTALQPIVINSHSHYDHIGGNHQFDTIYSLDIPYTRLRAAGLEHAQVAEGVSEGWIWKTTPPGFDRATYRIAPYPVAADLHDGDRIDLGGRVLEILVTPGHAPDAICVLDRANRMLFTGDTFYLAPLYTHLEGSNFEAYAKSAQRLASMADDVDLLMTSHNVPVASGRYLPALADAFRQIASGEAQCAATDGNRECGFDGFSIIVAGPE